MSVDAVELYVNNQKIDALLSYTVDSDLYVAADGFDIEIAGTDLFIPVGAKAQLRVNGAVEMTGIIDAVAETGSKSSESTRISGRDYMGLLCDHHCEEYGDKQALGSKTVKQLAQALLTDVPFIDRSSVVYANGADMLDAIYKSNYIQPGQTVFDVLKEYASGRGLLFYCLPTGTFVLGKPVETGAINFRLQRKRTNSEANNIVEGGCTRDISGSFSKAVIIGQRQGEDEFGSPVQINVRGSASVPTGASAEFPFYKPYVATSNKDAIAPSLEAKRFINASRAKMQLLSYTTPGHSQNGRNWQANELCAVVDDCCHNQNGTAINGTYLVYSRTFEMQSKESGPTTRLKLGMPGAILSD
jgi:prophage tail gpP-like protein